MTGIVRRAAALAALGVLAGPAAAQFGDTSLTYRDGVVYDDDLVPGAAPDRPFDPAAGAAADAFPRSSPDLLADPAAEARARREAFGRIESEAAQGALERGAR